MPNPRLATRYAKSLLDLAIEKGQLEEVKNDVDYLLSVIRMSKEFTNILMSPIIKPDKKQKILAAIIKDRTGIIMTSFCRLLVSKNRENVLPEMLAAFYTQYNTVKGINKVKFTTAMPVSDEVKKEVISKLTTDSGLANIELETAVDESLIGGFVLEYNNNIIDASILYDLKAIKTQFRRNDYIYNIR